MLSLTLTGSLNDMEFLSFTLPSAPELKIMCLSCIFASFYIMIYLDFSTRFVTSRKGNWVGLISYSTSCVSKLIAFADDCIRGYRKAGIDLWRKVLLAKFYVKSFAICRETYT